MKKLLHYISFLLTLALYSCEPESLAALLVDPTAVQDGKAVLYVNFNTASTASLTKAATPSAADGDMINNVRVWLVDDADIVVGYASSVGANPSLTIHQGTGNTDPTTERTTDRVTGEIENLSIGSYTMYALANAPEVAGVNWDNLGLGASFAEVKTATIRLAEEQLAPEYTEAQGMPLSLIRPVTIVSGHNAVNGQLIRVCARLKILIQNNTSAADNLNLITTKVHFQKKNADRTYVFSDGNTVPAYTRKDFKTAYNTTELVAAGETKEVYDSYIFETGVSLGSLSFDISGGVLEVGEEPEVDSEDGYNIGASVGLNSTQNGQAYFIQRNNAFLKGTNPVTADFYTSHDVLVNNNNNIVPYVWVVEGKDGTVFRLKNYQTNTYINLPAKDQSAVPLSTATNLRYDGSGRIFTVDGSGSNTYYNYLYLYSGQVQVDRIKTRYGSISDKYNWAFYLVSKRLATYYLTNPFGKGFFEEETIDINYIDEYSVERPLSSIMRNTVVEVLINVYYSPELNDFTFSVEQWIKEPDYETSFD